MVVFSLLLGLVGALVFLAISATVAPQVESKILAVGLVIAALVYVGFAIVGNASMTWVIIEAAGVGIYSTIAILGLRYSNWWHMLGWLVHPIWDVWIHFFARGADFTPAWYALGCVSFDLLVAAYICGVQLSLGYKDV